MGLALKIGLLSWIVDGMFPWELNVIADIGVWIACLF